MPTSIPRWETPLLVTLLLIAVFGAAKGAGTASYRGLVSINNDGQFYGVNTNDGSSNFIGQVSSTPWPSNEIIHSSTYDPHLNRIYLGWQDVYGGHVTAVDPETFEIISTVDTPFSSPWGLAYDSLGQHALASSGSHGLTLWEFDPSNGSTVNVLENATPPTGGNYALTYIPGDAALYIYRTLGFDDQRLVRYELATGVTTDIRSGPYYRDQGFYSLNSLEYNPDDGYIYALDTENGNLGRIDSATGEVTTLGTLTDSMTVVFIPEPSSALLLLAGSAVSLLARRR